MGIPRCHLRSSLNAGEGMVEWRFGDGGMADQELLQPLRVIASLAWSLAVPMDGSLSDNEV